MTILFWLLVGHAIMDYPLQGDFIARAKNHKVPVLAANGQAFPWWIALGNHALMHGGAVALVTGSVALGALEVCLHTAIDYLTSEGKTGGYVGDQALHVACKVVYVLAVLA